MPSLLKTSLRAVGIHISAPRTYLMACIANRLDIVALFDTHIGKPVIYPTIACFLTSRPGKVRKSEGVNDSDGMPLKISFFAPDVSQ